MKKNILQDWVMELGLRHQGTLLTAVRGCDTAPKDDPSKLFVRCFRDVILNPFCGDAAKAVSFIERVRDNELADRFYKFRSNLDHYPHHYVMHLVHSIEIIGYHHPDPKVKAGWHSFYLSLCSGLHMNPETKDELDNRLGASEEEFGMRDRTAGQFRIGDFSSNRK